MALDVLYQSAADNLTTIAQMHESTDIANHAHLLVYVKQVWDGDLQEHFRCSKEIRYKGSESKLMPL